jgi:amino acid transporter
VALHISLVSEKGLWFMQKANIEPRKFDWLGFISRQIPILALATWWIVERVRRNDRVGIIVLYVSVSLFLTLLNYLGARRV